MKKQRGSENSNFWISYADLMAGVLFVFILLIGAIIVKSSLLKKSLESKSGNFRGESHWLYLKRVY